VSGRARLRKEIDYETGFWCAGGTGILREEAWVDDAHVVVRYNLAFLLLHCFGSDNGRIVGFDNAHGVHERHFLGKVEPFQFEGYLATPERFYREAERLRRNYEDKDFRRRL
jgi:hypothetical protein